MDGVSLPQGYKSHYEEAVYFLPLRFQKFLVHVWLTSEGWKAESISERPSDFEHRTPELGIQHLNHYAIATYPGGAAIFNYSFVFGACCCCCSCCNVFTAWFLWYPCWVQFPEIWGNQCKFFDALKAVLYCLDSILNNFLLVVMFIIIFGKLSPKRNSDWKGTFVLKAWFRFSKQ